MTERITATITISASADAVFATLADPSTHGAIDGTGRVRAAVDDRRITATGQVFRVAMYHENHPDGTYEMSNEVLAFDPPHAISWRPGYVTDSGELAFGGWVWRYDLTPRGARETEVTLTYDWSAVGDEARGVQDFPPFPEEHLSSSLRHLATIVES